MYGIPVHFPPKFALSGARSSDSPADPASSDMKLQNAVSTVSWRLFVASAL
jgi:hypothetical protein